MSFFGRRFYGARFFGPRYFGRHTPTYVIGTLDATEGADSAALTGLVLVQGAIDVTEGADSADFSGYIEKFITLDATEGADSADFSGNIVDFGGSYFGRRYFGGSYFGPRYFGWLDSNESSGVLAATEGADTSSFTGDVYISGSLDATEGADVADIIGKVLVEGDFSGTEGADTASFAGLVLVQGTFTPTEGADTASFTGNIPVQGILDVTEGADGAFFVDDIRGNLDATEGADTADFAGDVLVQGTLDVTEGADGATFLDDVRGSLDATEGADSAAFSGMVLVQGTLAPTDGADSAEFEGFVVVASTLAAVEGADSGSFTGKVLVQGAFSLTEGADSGSFEGLLEKFITLAATEGADSGSFTGDVLVQGSLAVTEGADGATLSGAENTARPGYAKSGPVYLLEIDAHTGVTVETLRLTSGRSITTTADDTPSNTVFFSGMMDAGEFKRTLFENEKATTGRPALNGGFFEIANAGGERNTWFTFGYGRAFRLYLLADRADPVSTRTLIYEGTIKGVDATTARTSIRLKIRDKLEELVRPLLTARYGGSTNSSAATADGDSNMSGELKPQAWGYVYNVPVKPANSYDLIFQTAENSLTLQRPSDGGLLLTSSNQDFTTISALRSASISAGRYATANNLGLFRLGSTPEKAVTVECYSAELGDNEAGPVAMAMLLDAGVSSSDIDEDSFNALSSSTDVYRVGIYVDNDMTVLDAVGSVLNSVGASITCSALGEFKAVPFGVQVTSIPDPYPTSPPGNPIDTFTLADIGGDDAAFEIASTPQGEGDGTPIYAVNIRWLKFWRTLPPGDQNDGIVEEYNRHNLQKEYRELAQGNLAALTVHPGAQFISFDTLYTNGTGAIIEGLRRFELYGRQRDIVKFSVSAERAGTIDLGDEIELDIDGTRFEGGKSFYVIGRHDLFGSRRVIFTVWG